MTRVCKRKGRKQTICSNRSLILCKQNPTDQPDICQPVKGSILKPLNHSMNKASKRSPKAIYQMQQLHTPRGFCSSFLETSAPLLAMCVRVSLVSDPLNSFHFLGSFACLNFLLHVVGLMTRWMMGDGIYLESTRFWTLCTNSMICQVLSWFPCLGDFEGLFLTLYAIKTSWETLPQTMHIACFGSCERIEQTADTGWVFARLS